MNAPPAANQNWTRHVHAARTRMLFSHLPFAAPMGAGLAVLLLVYVHALYPSVLTPWSIAWGATTFLIECGAGLHAVMYLRSRKRHAHAWRERLILITGLTGVIWALAVWALPLHQHLELRATLVGATLGVAACGAFMFTADRLLARLFFVPIGLSLAVFCISLGDVRGLFGLVIVTGFMGVFWVAANRSHRRIGELLRLRYESEHLATLRAAALDEAGQLAKAKDMFLATMSHEMRTPLHGILGLSRMLHQQANDATTREQLGLIQSAGTHLLGVINDVLDLSRLQARRLALQTGPVDLPALAHEVTALAGAQAASRSSALDIRCEIGPEVPQWVTADAHRLRQVLINLMGNAVKFTPRGSICLRITADTPPPRQGQVALHFQVIDTGIGIPASEQARIFEPFHQLNAEGQPHAGTGLGLSISSQIAQAMGGTLTCQSEPGQGSTFSLWVALPQAHAPADVTPTSTPPTRVTAAAAHVLLVEDNPINTIVAKAALEQLGLGVTALENGRQAVEWLAMHQADLVLMDCFMPEMNGLEATRRIREREQRLQVSQPVPIIALTASTEPADRTACAQAGMNGFLAKPFTSEELTQVLSHHLGQALPCEPSLS